MPTISNLRMARIVSFKGARHTPKSDEAAKRKNRAKAQRLKEFRHKYPLEKSAQHPGWQGK